MAGRGSSGAAAAAAVSLEWVLLTDFRGETASAEPASPGFAAAALLSGVSDGATPWPRTCRRESRRVVDRGGRRPSSQETQPESPLSRFRRQIHAPDHSWRTAAAAPDQHAQARTAGWLDGKLEYPNCRDSVPSPRRAASTGTQGRHQRHSTTPCLSQSETTGATAVSVERALLEKIREAKELRRARLNGSRHEATASRSLSLGCSMLQSSPTHSIEHSAPANDILRARTEGGRPIVYHLDAPDEQQLHDAPVPHHRPEKPNLSMLFAVNHSVAVDGETGASCDEEPNAEAAAARIQRWWSRIRPTVSCEHPEPQPYSIVVDTDAMAQWYQSNSHGHASIQQVRSGMRESEGSAASTGDRTTTPSSYDDLDEETEDNVNQANSKIELQAAAWAEDEWSFMEEGRAGRNVLLNGEGLGPEMSGDELVWKFPHRVIQWRENERLAALRERKQRRQSVKRSGQHHRACLSNMKAESLHRQSSAASPCAARVRVRRDRTVVRAFRGRKVIDCKRKSVYVRVGMAQVDRVDLHIHSTVDTEIQRPNESNLVEESSSQESRDLLNEVSASRIWSSLVDFPPPTVTVDSQLLEEAGEGSGRNDLIRLDELAASALMQNDATLLEPGRTNTLQVAPPLTADAPSHGSQTCQLDSESSIPQARNASTWTDCSGEDRDVRTSTHCFRTQLATRMATGDGDAGTNDSLSPRSTHDPANANTVETCGIASTAATSRLEGRSVIGRDAADAVQLPPAHALAQATTDTQSYGHVERESPPDTCERQEFLQVLADYRRCLRLAATDVTASGSSAGDAEPRAMSLEIRQCSRRLQLPL